MALPTTTKSGCGCRFCTANGATGISRDARKSDRGGYAAVSEQVTRKPRRFSMPARDAIAVPQIPIRWMCLFSGMISLMFRFYRLPILKKTLPLNIQSLKAADRSVRPTRGGFQNPEASSACADFECCAHAERKRDVAMRDVAGS